MPYMASPRRILLRTALLITPLCLTSEYANSMSCAWSFSLLLVLTLMYCAYCSDVAPSEAEYEVEEEEEEVHGEGELDGSMISDLFDPLKEARRAFDKFDRDHSGSLDMKELNRALRCNGTKMKHRRLKKIMRIFDRDGSGTLSFDEFIRIPGVLPPEMGGVAAGDSDDDN